jgi:hypothetical protein
VVFSSRIEGVFHVKSCVSLWFDYFTSRCFAPSFITPTRSKMVQMQCSYCHRTTNPTCLSNAKDIPKAKHRCNKFAATHSCVALLLISNPSKRIPTKLVEDFQRRHLQTTATKQQAPPLFLLGQNWPTPDLEGAFKYHLQAWTKLWSLKDWIIPAKPYTPTHYCYP